VTFALVAITLVVQKLLENQAFPWTVRFALAAVPIPTGEAVTRVPTFAVLVIFALVAITLVVQKLFENQAFPWTARVALAAVPIPTGDGVITEKAFAVPEVFEETAKRFPP
jgi:hypothetical protein